MVEYRDLLGPVIVPSYVDVLTEDDRDTHDRGQLNITQSIVNSTGRTILLSTRTGVTYTIPHRPLTREKPGVYINYRTAHHRQVKINRHDKLNDVTKEKAIASELLRGYTDNTIGSGVSDIYSRANCLVPLERLKAAGGSVYLQELDLVVAFDDCPSLAVHPMTDPSILMGMGENGFNIKFRLIDNEAAIGDLYTNLNGTVMPIRTETSTDLQSGLYIVAPSAARQSGSRHMDGLEKTYFSPEDLKVKDNRSGFLRYIHSTHEEARTYGDSIAERERTLKLEIQEIKAQMQRDAMELEKVKRKYALEKEELDRKKEKDELERLDLEKQRRDIEHARSLNSMDRKDYYEHRSYARKDSAEWLKYAPVLISLVSACIPLFRGLSWKS